jgi:hypothetical protein
MGYFTEYNLNVRKIKNRAQFDDLVETMKAKDLIDYAFDCGNYLEKSHEAIFQCYDAVKWYEHSKDMLMLAEKFPNMYFMLEGAGEEYGDFWREYYHDMDIESCHGEIVYEQPKKVQWSDLIKF